MNKVVLSIQVTKRVGKRVTSFAKIAGFVRGLPMQLVFSRRSTEIHAWTDHFAAKQKFSATCNRTFSSGIQDKRIESTTLLWRGLDPQLTSNSPWQTRNRGVGLAPFSRKFSIESMNSLTSGRNLLRIQIENFKEISSNCCSLDLRKFVYGILSDVGKDDGKQNIKKVEEYDRLQIQIHLVQCWTWH